MLKLRVTEVAEKHGIHNAAELSRYVGVSYETAYRLWRGEVGGESDRRSIGILTMYRVAQSFRVTISDLCVEAIAADPPR